MQKLMNTDLASPWFDVDKDKDNLTLRFGGAWVCRSLNRVEPQLDRKFQKSIAKNRPVKIIIEKNCSMDSAGACLIARVIKALQNEKRTVDVEILTSSSLLSYFLTHQPAVMEEAEHLNWKILWLNYVGFKTVYLWKTTLNMLDFLGKILITWVATLKSATPLRWVSVFRHCEEIGVRALPIVGLISFLIGVVLSYQSINQLRRFGAEIYTIDFLAVSLLRELAVLLTAIVIAGRSGSAFTAQLGTMALNQEIDAIRMLGLNPIQVLVSPRLIAIIFCLPLLVFFAMMMGLLGGMLMTALIIDVSPIQFIHQFQRATSLSSFWVGMSKAPLFAILIGFVGCYRGFQVKGSAESVGRMTTQSVVESIFLVIIFDAFMSILFSYLKV